MLRKRLRRVRRILAMVSQPFLEGEAASEKFAQLRVSNLSNVLRLLGFDFVGTKSVQILSHHVIRFYFSRRSLYSPKAHDLINLHGFAF